MIGRTVATEGRLEDSSEVQTPHAGNGLSKNGGRLGISHCDERRTTRRREPSPMEAHGSHAPLLPPEAGSGSIPPGRPAGDGGKGWGGPTQALPGRGRGAEAEPGENEGASDVVPIPLPEGAAAGSQDTRCAAEYVARMRFHRESTQARGQSGNRALLAVRDNNSSLRWLPSLPPGATPGSRDPGGAWSLPRSTPRPPPGATSGQRHQESSDPTGVDPVGREAKQETRRPHRRRGSVEEGGDRSRTEDGAYTEGRISTRTRARTRAAAGTGERANGQSSGAAPPQQEVERFTPPAPQVEPVPSQTETPFGVPLPPQPGKGVMTSPAATGLGSPPTPTLLLGRSRVPVGEPSLSPAETASTPPELRSPISSAQPGTSSPARSPTGAQSRAEAGLETLRVRTPSPPPLMIPAPILP